MYGILYVWNIEFHRRVLKEWCLRFQTSVSMEHARGFNVPTLNEIAIEVAGENVEFRRR